MTLIEESFFRQISRQEYLHRGWEKPEQGRAPNVVKWIQRFNQVTIPMWRLVSLFLSYIEKGFILGGDRNNFDA